MTFPNDACCQVLLVGFEAQENLGLRSLAAFLQNEGIEVGIQPMQGVTRETILARALTEKPKLIGFSLIFQRMLDDYAELIAYLRANGVGGHFTMGGHFPTFEFEAVLKAMPGLDSVVRHEGEHTLLELFLKLDRPQIWGEIPGLASRTEQGISVAPLRHLIADLDSLPFPIRDTCSTTHRGIGIRSLAGSRGCYYDCSFCSISEFYRRTPGPARRTRSPRNVVQEMLSLYDQFGTQIFIFQDDDLFMRTPRHRDWLEEFVREIGASTLANRILWRVSCRVDDLDADCLRKMKEAGLVSVYLGIESASDAELAAMHKGYKAKDVYHAIDLIREVDLPFEFGFMLFTPDSVLETVRENLEFLKFVSANCDTLVNFCKMSPYAGTPIQRRLREQGRLEGSLACPDYRFLEPKLDLLQAFSAQTFNYRNFADDGLVERLRFAKFDVCLLKRLLPSGQDIQAYESVIGELIKRCNESSLDTMTFALAFLQQNDLETVMQYWHILEEARQQELATEQEITVLLHRVLTEYGFFAGREASGHVPLQSGLEPVTQFANPA